MINNDFSNYSPHFQEYMIKSFWPALAWAETKEGKRFILEHTNLTDKNLDDTLFAVYGIKINGQLAYIGQSIKPYKRALVHLFNIRFYAEEWGFKDDELPNITIEFVIFEDYLYKENERKKAELVYINQKKPILQQGSRTDRVVNLSQRRRLIEQYVLA